MENLSVPELELIPTYSPEVEPPSARELIIRIKNAKEAQHLSIKNVKELLAEKDVFPGDTTLRRLFAPGSEDNDSFNFEGTLRPIAAVLVDNIPASSPAVQAQLDLYRQLCLYKHRTIDSLHKQIDYIKSEQAQRCKICNENTELLKRQLDVKDRRMDEQAQRIDKLLDRLLDKI